MIRWTSAAAAVLAGALALAQGERSYVVEKDGITATVADTVAGGGSKVPVLKVSAELGARSAEWQYRNLVLDPELTGSPVADIVSTAAGHLLVVHAYTGGAGCCWLLLLFDLRQLRPLGQPLASRLPIEVVKDERGCELGALASPQPPPPPPPPPGGVKRKTTPRVKPPPPPELFHCFDGSAFRPRPRRRRAASRPLIPPAPRRRRRGTWR